MIVNGSGDSRTERKPRSAGGNAVVSAVEDVQSSFCVSVQHETEAGGAVGRGRGRKKEAEETGDGGGKVQ